MTLRGYIELLKLRIGVTIALTAVIGYVAVADTVRAWDLVLLTITMLLGSAASSVFNHYYDRDIDQRMTRTSNRPLARGDLEQPARVLWLALFLLAAGLSLAVSAFNSMVALHLFLGAFVYGIVYTVWLKRRSWLNIVIGGAAGSFAVLAGAAAVDPTIWFLPLLMAIFLFLWTPSHFWALAILLKDDYAKAGVPMLPCLIGDKRTAVWILVNSVLLVASSLAPWFFGLLGNVYGWGSLVAGVLLIWGNVKLLRDPSRIWARRNFLGSMLYLMAVFLAVVLDTHF